ncbi:MAG TPA: hypothetical protein VFA97_10125 [Gaiellaceae bacterium]|nr:hypothetical protein [Gaiellaceae bacterium]
MIRAFVLYDGEPDTERYAEHVELCRRVEGGTFRHGRIFGSPRGGPAHHYYAEWEFPDRAAFDAALRSEAFAATGKDAMAMGIPVTVEFAEVD